MEILGLDPKLMKCKFTVLPIKLYPLFLLIEKLKIPVNFIQETI